MNLLKWMGSKTRFQTQLFAAFEEAGQKWDHWIEPFVGGFGMWHGEGHKWITSHCTKQIMCDTSPTPILWRAVERDPWTVFRYADQVRAQISSAKDPKDEYLYARRQFNELLARKDMSGRGEAMLAGQLVAMNRYCFNGRWRTNRMQEFNMPYGHDPDPPFPDMQDFEDMYQMITSIPMNPSNPQCWRGGYRTALHAIPAGARALVYCDPPYAGTEQYGGAFSQDALSFALEILPRTCDIFVSNSYCDETFAAFSAENWRIVATYERQNSITGVIADRVKTKKEVLLRRCDV